MRVVELNVWTSDLYRQLLYPFGCYTQFWLPRQTSFDIGLCPQAVFKDKCLFIKSADSYCVSIQYTNYSSFRSRSVNLWSIILRVRCKKIWHRQQELFQKNEIQRNSIAFDSHFGHNRWVAKCFYFFFLSFDGIGSLMGTFINLNIHGYFYFDNTEE